MRKIRMEELRKDVGPHIFHELLSGNSIYSGGMFFLKAGEISHKRDGENAVHIHEEEEVFYFFEGKAKVCIDGIEYPAEAGDIFLIQAGEDHHIIAGETDLPVGCWLHAR